MKAAASLLGSIGNGCIYTPSDSHKHSCYETHDHTSKRFGTRSIVRSSDHSRDFVALSYNTCIVQQSHKDAGFTDRRVVTLDFGNILRSKLELFGRKKYLVASTRVPIHNGT